ncbi:hypothetical protein [Hyalangium sp.]|uniref:hypothetical protein n=1 Tax=Hyalangium sp. TaxID=2028555 RepID=UPI002D5D3660|nr:hypothetical protein [Hyalangium sp.]HYI00180.1 hypothetical protein [Hyalangium sp.]
MTTKYVDIEPTKLTPETLTVKPEDNVVFQMVGRTDIVTVAFPTGSPFPSQDTPFTLNGGNQLLASQSKTVTVTSTQSFSYTVTPTPSLPKPEDPEPPGTLQGDIDVSTDGPPKDK